ncbi:hypothetical protein [Sandarakinorhabdus glacialis]|nr:hypothetical protein [Polymorphobacter glacialis]
MRAFFLGLVAAASLASSAQAAQLVVNGGFESWGLTSSDEFSN